MFYGPNEVPSSLMPGLDPSRSVLVRYGCSPVGRDGWRCGLALPTPGGGQVVFVVNVPTDLIAWMRERMVRYLRELEQLAHAQHGVGLAPEFMLAAHRDISGDFLSDLGHTVANLAGPVLGAAATAIPGVGPIVGPLVGIATNAIAHGIEHAVDHANAGADPNAAAQAGAQQAAAAMQQHIQQVAAQRAGGAPVTVTRPGGGAITGVVTAAAPSSPLPATTAAIHTAMTSKSAPVLATAALAAGGALTQAAAHVQGAPEAYGALAQPIADLLSNALTAMEVDVAGRLGDLRARQAIHQARQAVAARAANALRHGQNTLDMHAADDPGAKVARAITLAGGLLGAH